MLGRILVAHWAELRAWPYQWHGGRVLLAALASAGGVLCLGWMWRNIVAALDPGHRLGPGRALAISVYAWAARYIPGKLAPVAGRIWLTDPARVSPQAIYLSSVYGTVLGFLGSLVLTLALLLASGVHLAGFGAAPAALLTGAVILAVGFLNSPPFLALLNRLLARAGRGGVEVGGRFPLSRRILGTATAALGHLLRMLGMYLFVTAVLGPMDPLPTLTIMAAAGVAGVLAVVAPGGLGVREGAMAFGLSLYLPPEMATLAAILTRLWEVALDGLLLAGTWGLERLGGGRR